jgi:uncharacterized membrane protein
MKTKEEKEKLMYEYEIKCFVREKMQSGKTIEQIIEALKTEKNINRENAILFINNLDKIDKDSSETSSGSSGCIISIIVSIILSVLLFVIKSAL